MKKWNQKLVLMFSILSMLNVMAFAGIGVLISDVQILPEQPSVSDILTIESQGTFPGGTLWHDTSVFSVDGYSLQLDLYFTGGTGPQIPQPWSHDDQIGSLQSGSYDLSVQTHWKPAGAQEYFLHDDYSTSFEVVPEPATFLLLGAGLLGIRKYTS